MMTYTEEWSKEREKKKRKKKLHKNYLNKKNFNIKILFFILRIFYDNYIRIYISYEYIISLISCYAYKFLLLPEVNISNPK